MLKRSDIKTIPEYYTTYTKKVSDIELLDALQMHVSLASENWLEKAYQLGDTVYEIDKWTINQLIQHLIDAERILAYRALRVARADKTPLPGFDEGDYCKNADVSKKSFQDLVTEFNTVRLSTIQLFKHLDETTLRNVGNCSGGDISVLGIGFTIIGHQIHHLKVIEERYFSLLNN